MAGSYKCRRYNRVGMEALITRIARRSRITRAAAADQLNSMIYDVLNKLKKGEQASIPGLGTLAGKPPRLEPEPRVNRETRSAPGRR